MWEEIILGGNSFIGTSATSKWVNLKVLSTY